MAAKDRDDFFDVAKPHSVAKIELLNSYLIPWIRKVTFGMNQKCLICDTFAGEGIYSDGTLGSPFIIINNALDYLEQNPQKTHEVLLAFVEANSDNYKKLKKNIEDKFSVSLEENTFNQIPNKKMRIMISNSTHEEFINELSLQVNNLVPSLFFVDPFGYKGVNINEITSIMNKYKSCEFIVNFIYDEFIRFKSKESIKQIVTDFFGSGLEEAVLISKNMSPKDRRNYLISKYKENIKNNGVKYVLDFDIQKDNSSAIKMILVFMSNNHHGYNLMKLSMLNLCKNIEFEYRTSEKGLVSLFSLFDDDMYKLEMIYDIEKKFKGRTVFRNEIELYCREHPFIPEDLTVSLLKELGKTEKLYVLKDGKEKKNPGQFPKDCPIVFK